MNINTGDVRLSISEEVKTNVLPKIDDSDFLGFNKDERASLYIFAASLAIKIHMTPKEDSLKRGLIRMSSVSSQDLTQMILIYLSGKSKQSFDESINLISESRRKEMAHEIDKIANSGFMIMKEYLTKPEDIVIAELIDEMDTMYKEYQENFPEWDLPKYSPFEV
jgi:hypothetical protein